MRNWIDLLRAVLTLILPPLGAAVVAFLTRPRIEVLGFWHITRPAGRSYKFYIHYLDDARFVGPVEIVVRIIGSGAIAGVGPTLLAGPGYPRLGKLERGSKEPDEPAGRRYVFRLRNIRPRATWVIQFLTNGLEQNAVVKVIKPFRASVPAIAPESRRKRGWLAHQLELYRALLLTIAVAACLYGLAIQGDPKSVLGYLINVTIRDTTSRDSAADEYLVKLRDSDYGQSEIDYEVELVCVGCGIIAVVAVHELTLRRRRRRTVSPGYLGWHPGIQTMPSEACNSEV